MPGMASLAAPMINETIEVYGVEVAYSPVTTNELAMPATCLLLNARVE